MSWYSDLSTATMVIDGPHVRAVGWLSAGQPFPTGSSLPDFLARLKRFCECWEAGIDSLHWELFLGPHTCELCDSFMAAGNIGVPAGELLYVAPEMVAHYVEVHRYAPPAEFVAAVMSAPLPGTPKYDGAVRAFREFEIRRAAGTHNPRKAWWRRWRLR
jgi:hypothetical protein